MRGPSNAFLALLALAAALTAMPGRAATQAVIPDALQQEAMTCVGEAMQICPDVWTAEDHGLACMTGKRQSFSPRCRVIYDKVAHVLGR
ncbi:hypothetical protein [Lichenibacterium dinghuense]|uniref:hypothetical protein n=1 Tax=Lichenibacterium dinghuense TaxID=2895977 RepID=UPI001F2B6A47|nr:hypothetical protein [Lichenibacterium sp. 6Y81]